MIFDKLYFFISAFSFALSYVLIIHPMGVFVY
nr:MAG TPA: hypothetical protein [Caudoviricetes sp.]